jgi:hypothetical protein
MLPGRCALRGAGLGGAVFVQITVPEHGRVDMQL